MKKSAILCIFIILTVSFIGCIEVSDNDLTLVIGQTDKIFGFHPLMESYDVATMTVNHNIYNTLIEFDGIFRIKPALATSWNNPNNHTWRFNLRENVIFHNGYDFTAEDVKYSIDLIKEDSNSVLKDLIISISEVVIIDNHTVDIKTEKPFPILLNKLVDIPIISKKYQMDTNNQLPIGTGPYKLVEYISNDYVKLERFDDYWDTKPDFKNVIFKYIEDDLERADALNTGEIDIAEDIVPKSIKNLSKNKDVLIKTISSPTTIFLSFDFKENDSISFPGEKNPLSDKRIRKALYHAIDEQYIIENVLNGTEFAESASQFVSPLIFGYNPNITRLSYDLDLSRQLLKEAGYENGFDLVLDCPRGFYGQDEIGKVVVDQLSEIINISLNIISIDDYFNKILTRNSSFYIVGWLLATGDGGEIFDYLIRTVDEEKGIGTYNIGYYSNAEVDLIGEKISYTMDPGIRLNLMQDGFSIAMDDVACIPLIYSKSVYGISTKIQWEPPSNMIIRISDISVNN